MKNLLATLFVLISFSASGQVEVMNYEEFKTNYMSASDEAYVLNFWATWCAPCVKELPYFEEAAEKGKDDFTMILVSLDFPKHIDSRLLPFLEKKRLKSKVVLLDEANANVFIDDIDPSWSGAIPATLIWKGEKKAFAEAEFHSIEEVQELIYTALNKEQ